MQSKLLKICAAVPGTRQGMCPYKLPLSILKRVFRIDFDPEYSLYIPFCLWIEEHCSRKTAKELLFTDYKEFHIAGHDLAVAQVTCVDSANMLSRKEELLIEMRAAAKKKDVSLLILMLTDVLLEGSQLLYVGSDDVISQAFGVMPRDNEVFLPKVMS